MSDDIQRPGLSTRKKMLFAAVVLVAVPTLVELLLALCGVDPVVGVEDPYVGFTSSIPLFTKEGDDDGREIYRTSPNRLGWFNEQSFPGDKGRTAYRVFCLGGSTTFGRPYNDRTSFVGWLRVFLSAADPQRDWEVINCGGVSYASYRVAALLEELIHYDPDLFIIYTGHNEFLERRTYSGIIEEHPVVRKLNLILHQSRIVSIMGYAAGRIREAPREAAKRRYRLTGEVTTLLDTSAGLDLYQRDDLLRQQIVSHYRFNLGRMAAMAESVGAEVIFINPAANIKDSSPFKSQHRDNLTDGELTEWQVLFDRGLEAARQDNHTAAREAFEGAVQIDDRYARLHYELGRTLLATGQLDGARSAFERARSEDVCALRILPEMSEALAEVARQHEVTLIDYAAALEERCHREYGCAMLGTEYFLDQVHPTIEAHRFLSRLVLDHLIAERVVRPAGDWSDAKVNAIAEELEGTLDQRDHAHARVALARVLRWAGKLEESDRLIASAAQVIGDEPEFMVMHAGILERQGKPNEAIEQYERALRLKAGIREAYVSVGRLLVKQGRVEEGIARYHEALRISPEYAVAHHGLGQALGKLGRFNDAVDEFQRTLRIAPGRPDTHASLAEALIELGHLDEAVRHLGEALRINPRYVKAHTLMGVTLIRLGRLDGAIEHYRSALRYNPEDAQTYYNLGTALVRQGSLDQAVHHFEQAVCIRPDFADAHFNLGLVLLELKKLDQAAQHLERVLEIAPDDRAAYHMLEIVIDLAKSAGEIDLVNRIQQKLGHYSTQRRAHPTGER